MLKIRVLTASILGAALLLVLFVLPADWSVAVFGVVMVLAAWEWSGFGSLRRRALRLAYAGAASRRWWPVHGFGRAAPSI